MDKFLTIAARVLMSQVFIISGLGKIIGYSGSLHYFASLGIPGLLLPVVILIEVGCGLLLLLGYKTKYVAAILAVFALAAALLAHTDFGAPGQLVNFTKDFALAGGLILFVKFGAGRPSIDHKT